MTTTDRLGAVGCGPNSPSETSGVRRPVGKQGITGKLSPLASAIFDRFSTTRVREADQSRDFFKTFFPSSRQLLDQRRVARYIHKQHRRWKLDESGPICSKGMHP